MQVKTCPATIKAAGDHEGTDEGVFEAVVAAYNVDSVNDRIVPGAFKASLDQWKASGNPIPVIWSHKSDDPDYHIGYVEEAEERDEGLWVRARLDLDEPKSSKVYKLLKGRRVANFSFAYDIDEARPGKKDDGSSVQELHRLTLHEVGPCLIGANRATALLDVKHDQTAPPPADAPALAVEQKDEAVEAITKLADSAADLKAGRTLSKQNEDRVTEIARLASELLASVKAAATEETDSNAEKATPVEPADAAPASAEAKAAVPAQTGTASARLRTDLDLMWVEAATYTI